MYKNRIIGINGEDIAIKYIEEQGMKLVERNFYCKSGEIDIIAKDKDELVFIEVKTRTNTKYGVPAEAVNIRKQKHMYHAIEYYLYSNRINNINVRIDVIEILLSKKQLINHIKNICI